MFQAYAAYYDLVYSDKAYAAEAAALVKVLQLHAPGARSLLELGCGTGGHAEYVAAAGYSLHGIDVSPDMLAAAARRRDGLPRDVAAGLSFEQADIRTYQSDRSYDAVVSLFHVFSYQAGNEDFAAALATARRHLAPGGLLVFDFWYGPCVLTERPSVRVKRLENELIEVLRISEPVLHVDRNVVDVNFTIVVRDKASGQTETLRERHPMRYFFEPEIRMHLKHAGFECVEFREWMTDRPANATSWNVYCVARAHGGPA